jgi:hypothetical protein
MTVKTKILELFEKTSELTVKEIVDRLSVSKQMVHLVLKELVETRTLEKLGRTPKTVYRLAATRQKIAVTEYALPQDKLHFLKDNFLVVTDTGDLLEGIEAFALWCQQRKLPVSKTVSEFITTKEKYASYYDRHGNINGLEKLQNTKGYEKIWLDKVYYLDFYAIERFGKTRLGTLLHYAKQGQNKFLMDIMMNETAERIRAFIESQNADAVGFVPPTIRRELQLMKFVQSRLNIALPVIDIKKLTGIIPVPQKSLSKLDERIRNAENSFAVTEQRKFKRVVLIDDAVGSGATINQIAGKIKAKEVAQHVTGLAIVGSFKGFDVITDV